MSIDKLRAHFGFTKMPFSKNIPPAGLHPHRGHQEAVARIAFLVDEVAIGVITGEVGAGKTVAARAAISALEPARHTVIYLSNPAVGTRGFYSEIVFRLGGEPRYLRARLIAQATALLAAEAAERGRRIVIVCDEAHLLEPSQLEALRLLTAAEMDSANPFALVLLGQPTLRGRLRLGAFAALDQRITLRYAIPAMTREESASYLVHHLRLAGRSDTLFSEDAVQRIHEAARGLPRALNNLARQALVAAFANRSSIVDEKAARQAVAEFEAD